MLSSNLKRTKFFNQDLYNFCFKSTNESIKKIVEKNDKERNLKNIKINLIKQDTSSQPNNNYIISLIGFLSISSIFYIFYRTKK